ncbi:PAC2 family protein [Mycobacterium avium subsp. avium 2285 (R)]|nr:PAC2 family protein [Mycobacterium avium subsp. avium 2285 (R)]
MAVPHTRPITMTAHSNNPELIKNFQPWIAEIQVPGSASNLLEYRMAQHGHEVVGYTVHVPHYLTQTDYPAPPRRCSSRSPRPRRWSCR